MLVCGNSAPIKCELAELMIRQGKARQGKARQGKARQFKCVKKDPEPSNDGLSNERNAEQQL